MYVANTRNVYVPNDVKEDVVHMVQLVASYSIGSTSHKSGIGLNTTAATIKHYSGGSRGSLLGLFKPPCHL